MAKATKPATTTPAMIPVRLPEPGFVAVALAEININ